MTQPVNKRPPGRPKGYSPGQSRIITHTVGAWTWNHDLLLSKIAPGATEDDCYEWRGAKSPSANLFGAFKNHKPRMTQVNRLLMMADSGASINEISIRLSCGNKFCCNKNHFETDYNKMWQHADGTPSRCMERVYG